MKTTNQKNIHPIVDEIGKRLVERLEDIKQPFHNILDIHGDFAGVKHLLPKGINIKECKQAQPLDENFDLVVSNLSFTTVKDLQKTLLISGKSLKKDGLLIASILGGESFAEIKEAFHASGSKNGHTALFVDIQTCGSLLQSLKFALPVIDREIITLHYTNFKSLWEDIRSLGKLNNHPQKHKGLMTPAIWQKMEEYYWNTFATPEGYIPLTLEIIYITGWRADKSQQKPLPMGTKAIPLANILK